VRLWDLGRTKDSLEVTDCSPLLQWPVLAQKVQVSGGFLKEWDIVLMMTRFVISFAGSTSHDECVMNIGVRKVCG